MFNIITIIDILINYSITMKLLLPILFLSFLAKAQTPIGPVGAGAWSLGGSSVAEKNIFGINNNMAATADLKNYRFGIYNRTPFLLKQLNTINSSFLLPTKFLNLGLSVSSFGYEKFNQQNISFGLAKKLHPNFNLGITFNYITINIAEQENTGAFTGSISTYYKVNKDVQIGLVLFNPFQSTYSIKNYGSVNTFGRVGLKYQLSKSINFIGELEKNLDKEMILRGGLSYIIHPKFDLNIGYAKNPNLLTFGFNAKVKQFEISFAAAMHEVLGLTPHVGLVFYGK